MKILNGLNQLNLPSCALTVGNFDGLHRGHRALIANLCKDAKGHQVPAVVMTFDPHPSKILHPDHPIPKLFDRSDLEVQLENGGVEYLIIEPFTYEFSQMGPEQFIKNLVASVHPRIIWVGHDFVFGKNKSGNFEVLERLADHFHIELKKLEPCLINGEIVSSSLVRKSIQEGDVEKASKLLNRPYYLEGVIEKGEGRGDKIGFPTANLKTEAEIIPATGVYATRFCIDGKVWPSVTNIGRKPTFHQDHRQTIESHVWDCNLSFLGKKVRLEFVKRLRSELKFPSAHELIEQIKIDIHQAKSYLAADV